MLDKIGRSFVSLYFYQFFWVFRTFLGQESYLCWANYTNPKCSTTLLLPTNQYISLSIILNIIFIKSLWIVITPIFGMIIHKWPTFLEVNEMNNFYHLSIRIASKIKIFLWKLSWNRLLTFNYISNNIHCQ